MAHYIHQLTNEANGNCLNCLPRISQNISFDYLIVMTATYWLPFALSSIIICDFSVFFLQVFHLEDRKCRNCCKFRSSFVIRIVCGNDFGHSFSWHATVGQESMSNWFHLAAELFLVNIWNNYRKLLKFCRFLWYFRPWTLWLFSINTRVLIEEF